MFNKPTSGHCCPMSDFEIQLIGLVATGQSIKPKCVTKFKTIITMNSVILLRCLSAT